MSRPLVLIDLTGDASGSDDNSSRATTKRPRSFYQSAGAPAAQSYAPASNHGLSNTAAFNRDGVLGNNYLLNGPRNGNQNSVTAIRPSARQVIKAEDKGMSKSQKPLLPVIHSPRNVNPVNGSKTVLLPSNGIKRRKTVHEGQLPVMQVSLQAQQYQSNQNQQSRHDESPKALPKSIITGDSRAGVSEAVSRIRRDGAIQKPQSSKPNTCDMRVSTVLRCQLIPHVSRAMKPYREFLMKTDRSEVGSKIASLLVSEPGFMKDLGNRERLSDRYETFVVAEAERLAAASFKTLQAKGRTIIPTHFGNPQTDHNALYRPVVADSSGMPDSNRIDSEISTDAEELFDDHLYNESLPGMQSRGHSFSPSTSFSNDMVDVNSSMGEEEKMDSQEDGTRRFPNRATRASQPIYAKPKRTRGKRKPGWGLGTPKAAKHSSPPVIMIQDDEVVEERIHDDFPDDLIPLEIATPTAVKTVVPTIQQARKIPPARITRDPIGELLRQREIHGMSPIRARYGQSSFKAVANSYFEDCFVRQSEWTDCSGTILSLTWTSPNAFICGAVAHSDCNHMQYNKPGNLLLGSITHDTLRAFPDHRMIRPIVSATENASNALEAMRQTQDPWMYAPVVTTAHSEYSGYTFTASFDKTVKAWSLEEDGSTMVLRGTWAHDDKVNFVAASKHHERVATASESMSDAVRVYNLDEWAVSASSYDEYCGNKASVQAEDVRRREKWAYYPSTIQWGLAERVKYLLLVGWSPRSDSGEDHDIPEDKRHTGELCLWNSLDSKRVPINSAHLQNVFEVIWHPTQPFFLAATSPSGIYDTDNTKTQVRLFGLSPTGSFLNNKTFDCPAWDVNELTIMPTSGDDCFVTVSCTDRCTYVYDSKRGDQPIHVLQHGESLDEPENEDSGVKFAAWGKSNDRFYTGSSDGELIAWNIKAPPGKAFVRNILKLSGGIYAGAFSKDYSKLIIGDDTGKVHLLGLDDSDLEDDRVSRSVRVARQLASMSNGLLPTSIKRPKLVIPHPEPLHPEEPGVSYNIEQSSEADDIAKRLLDEGHLRMLPDSQFPMARKGIFQGPNYDEILLYRYEAHEDNDASKPLLPEFLHKQQYQQEENENALRLRKMQGIGLNAAIRPRSSISQSQRAHRLNLDLDFSFEKLSLSTQVSLTEEKAEVEGDFIFDYEIMPSEQHMFLRD